MQSLLHEDDIRHTGEAITEEEVTPVVEGNQISF